MKAKIQILILLFILFSGVYGQGNWQVYTKDDGLASGSVKELFEDSKGNIWALTTVWGVIKFDGTSWTNYTKSDGLVSKEISTIFEDSKGNIWLGGFSEKRKSIHGVMRFNGDSFEIISKKVGTDKFYEDKSGNIWFGKMLPSMFDGNTIKTFTKKNGYIPTLFANDIFYNKINDSIWIITKKGLTSYNGTDWVQHSEESGAPIKNIKDLKIDQNGVVWVASKGGVFSYSNSVWKHYTPEKGMVSEDVVEFFVDSQNNVWAISGKNAKMEGLVSIAINALSKSDLLVYKNNEWNLLENDPNGPTSRVTKVFEASNGDLWFNTYTTGFYRYNGNKWQSFRKDKGFKANHFQSLFEDSRGNLWFGLGAGGFTGEGLGIFDGDSWRFVDQDNVLPSNRVLSIIEDRNENIWLGTFKGIVKYSPN